MNICINTSSFPANRHEIYHRYLEDVINLLHKEGYVVTVLTQNTRADKNAFIPNVRVVWFPWKVSEKNVLSEISLKKIKNIFSAISLVVNGVRFSKKVVAENKIELFICLWIIPSGLYVCLKNIFFKKTPYVLWALGSDIYNYKDNFFTKRLLRFIIRRAKASFADGYELCEIVAKLSGRECQFLPTFRKIYAPEAVKEKNTTDDFSFLFVGRLSQVKGVDLLIEAIILLQSASSSINLKCTIVGDGELTPALTKKIKDNKLENTIFLVGRVTDEQQIAEHFKQADCIVIPSRSESIPIVLSEAVQFGVPVVVSNAGDMEYIVKKYNIGLVAEKENTDDLAKVMKEFMSNPVIINPSDKARLLEELLFENKSKKLLMEIEY